MIASLARPASNLSRYITIRADRGTTAGTADLDCPLLTQSRHREKRLDVRFFLLKHAWHEVPVAV